MFAFPGSVAYSNASFGQGTGSIFMVTVRCMGNESQLLDCLYRIGSYCGGHGDDAGVKCFADTCKYILPSLNYAI